MFLYVKALIFGVLLCPVPVRAQVSYYAEPHLPAGLYQELRNHLNQTSLGQLRPAQDHLLLLRMLDYRRQDSERPYWSQVRLDQQQQIFMLKLRLELWQSDQLRWQSTIQVRRPLRYLADEVKTAGQPLLGSFLSQEAGLLQFPTLSGPEESLIRKELAAEASRLLIQDLARFTTTIHIPGVRP